MVRDPRAATVHRYPEIHAGNPLRLLDGKGGRCNSFVFFSDPDGNGWVLQERPGADD